MSELRKLHEAANEVRQHTFGTEATQGWMTRAEMREYDALRNAYANGELIEVPADVFRALFDAANEAKGCMSLLTERDEAIGLGAALEAARPYREAMDG